MQRFYLWPFHRRSVHQNGVYKNILLVGSEMHSMGLDFTTRGRNVTVIFGDGAGAVVLQPTTQEAEGYWLPTCMQMVPMQKNFQWFHREPMPANIWVLNNLVSWSGNSGRSIYHPKMLDEGMIYPNMNGQLVFKTAVVKFPEVIQEALQKQVTRLLILTCSSHTRPIWESVLLCKRNWD